MVYHNILFVNLCYHVPNEKGHFGGHRMLHFWTRPYQHSSNDRSVGDNYGLGLRARFEDVFVHLCIWNIDLCKNVYLIYSIYI